MDVLYLAVFFSNVEAHVRLGLCPSRYKTRLAYARKTADKTFNRICVECGVKSVARRRGVIARHHETSAETSALMSLFPPH